MAYVDVNEVQELFVEQSMKIQQLQSQVKLKDAEIDELKKELHRYKQNPEQSDE